MAVDVAQLLSFTVKNNASDLHLSGGVPPMIRVDGDIKRVNMPALTHKDVNSMVYDIMNDKQRKDYEEFLETDFSFEIPKLARFRVNAFNQNRGSAAVFRIIPSDILTLDDLGAPAIFKDICMYPRGIVLVTGPTGSGKSTTLAAMVDYINDNKPDHILTIEDPIEFVHESKKSLINQREVYRDTLGFNEALRSALREDPDVILVGELRDQVPLTAGHGNGAYRGSHRIRVSEVCTVSAAFVSCELNHFDPPPSVGRLLRGARAVRTYGCASQAITLVATGALDVHVDRRARPCARQALSPGDGRPPSVAHPHPAGAACATGCTGGVPWCRPGHGATL